MCIYKYMSVITAIVSQHAVANIHTIAIINVYPLLAITPYHICCIVCPRKCFSLFQIEIIAYLYPAASIVCIMSIRICIINHSVIYH